MPRRNWTVEYPVREELRLPVMAAPLSDEMAALANDILKTAKRDPQAGEQEKHAPAPG